MEEQTKKYPTYLDNKPIGDDLFNGESHKRLAKVISSHLNDKSSPSRLIGLEGAWGSGKSNLIKILEKDLLKDSHHFFVFDLWGSQNDNLRNTFLAELVSSLEEEKGILNQSKTPIEIHGKMVQASWQERLTTLFSQKKRVEKREVPKMNSLIGVLLILIALSPLLKPFIEYIGTFDLGKSIIISLFIVSVVFGVLLFTIQLIHDSITEDGDFRFSSMFYILKGKRLDTDVSETVRNHQPTVSDFRKFMKEISKSLNKELVIVYDNMDRMKDDQIHSIWSSIHTFFAETSYPKIWVIVPFAKNQILASFDIPDSSKKTKKGEYFIKKTFPFTFRVPPPVLSDWKKLFRQKLKDAFGTSPIQDQNIIINLFDLLTQNKSTRNIIYFINELVKLKKIWGEEYSNKYYALYILNEDSIHCNLPDCIIQNNFYQNTATLFHNDSEVQDIIASLAYNVSKDHASEVTLKPSIELSLQNSDMHTMEKLIKHPNFPDIFDKTIKENSGYTIQRINCFEQIIKKHVELFPEETIDTIFLILTNILITQSPSPLNLNGEIKILYNRNKTNKLGIIKLVINNLLNANPFNHAIFAKKLLELDSICHNHDVFSYIQSIDMNGPQLFEVIPILKHKYAQLTKDISPLDELISSNIQKSGALSVVKLLTDEDCERMSKTINTIKNGMQSQNTSSQSIIHITMPILRALTRNKPYKEIWNPSFLQYASQRFAQYPNGQFELALLRLCTGSEYRGQDNFISFINNNEEFKEFARENILKHKTLPELIEIEKIWINSTLNSIIKGILIDDEVDLSESVQYIVEYFSIISNKFDIPHKQLINLIAPFLSKKDASTFKNIDHNLISISLSENIPSLIPLQELEFDRLSSQENEIIMDILSNRGTEVDLLGRFLLYGNKELPQKWATALQSFLLSISHGDINYDDYWPMPYLVKHMDHQTSLSELSNKILEKIEPSNSLNWDSFKLIMIPVILNSLTPANLDQFVNDFLAEFVDSNDVKNYFENHNGYYGHLFKKTEKHGGKFRKAYRKKYGSYAYNKLKRLP